jgi:1,2-diacylglycerol 3-alpha-glucosyltransferase
MRIAFFTDSYLPQRDGVVSTIVNFRKELEKEGHEVFIFAAGSRKDKRENRDAHVFYHTAIPFRPYPDYKVVLFPVRSLAKVRSLKVDMIHTHSMAGMGVAAYASAKALGKPLVGTFHTLLPEATHYISRHSMVRRIGKRLLWNYLRLYYNRCGTVMVPSKWIGELIASKGIRNSVVVPPGIYPERFARGNGNAFREKHGLGKAPVIMYVGRVAEEKNLETLIKSAIFVLEEMPKAKFVIVGKGPAQKNYAELARRQGIGRSFVFTGFVKDEELPDAYHACDVLAFPSTFETLGMVALEAMACGKPVAAADYGPLREVVRENVNGGLFNARSAEQCAEAIVRVYKARRRFAPACRKTAAEYAAGKSVRKLVQVYEKALRQRDERRKRWHLK